MPFLAEEGNVIEDLHFYSYLGWGGGKMATFLSPPPQQTHEHVHSNTPEHHNQI